MKVNYIHQGDILQVLKTFPNGCIDTIITSPPYWGLRDYDVEGQIGLEPTLEGYIGKLLQITVELKRVLKSTGVMFWNHGDCYGGSPTGSLPNPNKNFRSLRSQEAQMVGQEGIKKSGLDKNKYAKCLVMQNYRLILKMIDEQGWILRNSIVWNKPNHMPSSVRDRFASSYEPVFMLVKKQRYWWDLDAVRISWRDQRKADIQRALNNHPGYQGKYGKDIEKRDILPGQGIKGQPVGDPTMGKNPGDVWTIPTQPFPESHFATFPEKLIIPMIKSSCPEWICRKCGKARERIIEHNSESGFTEREYKDWEKKTGIVSQDRANRTTLGLKKKGSVKYEGKTMGWTDCSCNAGWDQGIVLDPFMGSGTVAKVARELHRKYIGIEISEEYIKIANRRLAQGVFDF